MIRIDPWAYFFGALLILTLPLDWLMAAFFAAAFHELCHIAAIRALSGRIGDIRVGIGGAVIETELPDKRAELISAIAGPLGSLFLLVFCHIFPKLSICACVQGLFNLLPVYPMDGGRILRCGLAFICPGAAERIGNGIEIMAYFFITILAAAGTFVFSMGFFPLFTAMLLMIKAILRKRPCKRR